MTDDEIARRTLAEYWIWLAFTTEQGDPDRFRSIMTVAYAWMPLGHLLAAAYARA